MQTPTPLTAKDARKLALRRGLFFGISAGCIFLLITAFSRAYYNSGYLTELSYLIVLLAFFAAGALTTRKTNRLDMGARAGLWAGVAVTLFLLASTLLVAYHYRASHFAMLFAALGTIPVSLLALIVGPAVGMLGGLVSNKSDADSVSPPPPSAQPTSAPASPPQPSPPPQQQA